MFVTWTNQMRNDLDDLCQVVSRFKWSCVSGRGDAASFVRSNPNGELFQRYNEGCRRVSNRMESSCGFLSNSQERLKAQTWESGDALHYDSTASNIAVHATHMKAEKQIAELLCALEEAEKK